MDKAGAVIGPLPARALLLHWGETPDSHRARFAVAFVPALLGLLVLASMRDQPGPPRETERFGQHRAALGPGFKRLLWPAGVFAPGDYSLGFMLVRAHALGFGVADIVLLGCALDALVNAALLFVDRAGPLVALFALCGLFYAIEDSQSRAFIADLEPPRRATAIGLYNVVTGALDLPAPLIAGALWSQAPSLAFGLPVALSLLSIGSFVALRPSPIAPEDNNRVAPVRPLRCHSPGSARYARRLIRERLRFAGQDATPRMRRNTATGAVAAHSRRQP